MTKLLVFRIAMIAFIITNFIVSYKMESFAECFIMMLNIPLCIGYISAEVITKLDECKAEEESYI